MRRASFRMHGAASIVVTISLIGDVCADVFTWDSSRSGFFNEELNWSPVGVPGAGDAIRFGFTFETSELPIDVSFDGSATQIASVAEVFAGDYRWATDAVFANVVIDGPVRVGFSNEDPPFGLPVNGSLSIDNAPIAVQSGTVVVGEPNGNRTGALTLRGDDAAWSIDGDLAIFRGGVHLEAGATLSIPGSDSTIQLRPPLSFSGASLTGALGSVVCPDTDVFVGNYAQLRLDDMHNFSCKDLVFGPGDPSTFDHGISSIGQGCIGSIHAERSLDLDLGGNIDIEGSVLVSTTPNSSSRLNFDGAIQMENLTIGNTVQGTGFAHCTGAVVVRNTVTLYEGCSVSGNGTTIGIDDSQKSDKGTRLTSGGLVCGLGSIRNFTVDGGELRPGLPFGRFAVLETFEISSGAIRVDLGIDRVMVVGEAILGGTLIADLIPGLMLSPGTEIEVLTCFRREGNFASLVNNTPFNLKIIADDTSVYVRVFCRSDVDGDDEIGLSDLLQVLGAWGPCADGGENPATCPSDVNRDATVGFEDLVLLISDWGICGKV